MTGLEKQVCATSRFALLAQLDANGVYSARRIGNESVKLPGKERDIADLNPMSYVRLDDMAAKIKPAGAG
jgi:hypothetical protein